MTINVNHYNCNMIFEDISLRDNWRIIIKDKKRWKEHVTWKIMLTFESEKTYDNKVEYEDKMITQQVGKRIRRNPKTIEDSSIN